MLTKFETKSARVKGSEEEEEEGNNGSWMLGDGGDAVTQGERMGGLAGRMGPSGRTQRK